MDSKDSFLNHYKLDSNKVQSILDSTLNKADDGELYLQYSLKEIVKLSDSKISNTTYTSSQGFGLRGVYGETCSYAHASEISESSLKRASEHVKSIQSGNNNIYDSSPSSTNHNLYSNMNPLDTISFEDKVNLLISIDKYARKCDPHVKQVEAFIKFNYEYIHILRMGDEHVSDIRPMIYLYVKVIMEKDGIMEKSSYGYSRRHDFDKLLNESRWKKAVDETIRQASVNIKSRPSPAGEMPVILGSGNCGTLLHEAIGHGLEGDFIRKETSIYTGRIGEKVAHSGITVIDDGTIKGLRGSLNIDDEGTPTSENILIENGILKGYMQDRLNSRLMGSKSTGNCRRESYSNIPMPRMTNTYMKNGDKNINEMIETVNKGIYCPNFSSGQVDITNGNFVFSCDEAYMIENGKVTYPIKGATLIGNGPEVLQNISMIGNDLEMDDGDGNCGKNGQSVPVTCGQPSIKIDKLTVGGTST